MRRRRSVLGRLDGPKRLPEFGSRIIVRGWAIDEETNAAAAVRISIGGKIAAPLPFARDDVVRAFPDRILPEDCGFWLELDVPIGVRRLKVEAFSPEGWCLVGWRLVVGLRPMRADRTQDFVAWKRADLALLEAEREEIKRHIALVGGGPTFTLVVGSDPFTPEDNSVVSGDCWNDMLISPKEAISFRKLRTDGVATEFAVLIGPGDRLRPDALYRFTAALIAEPDADVVYGDDEVCTGQASTRRSKPDWSPETFRHFDYLGSGVCIRSACVRPGRFKDRRALLQQVTDRTARVLHLRRVLCEVQASPPTLTESERSASSLLHRERQAAKWKRSERFVIFCLRDPGSNQQAAFAEQKGVEARIELAIDRRDLAPISTINLSYVNKLAFSVAPDYLLAFYLDGIMASDSHLQTLGNHFDSSRVGIAGPRLMIEDRAELGMMFHQGNWFPIIAPPQTQPSSEFLVSDARNVSAVRLEGLVVRAGLFQEIGGFEAGQSLHWAAAALCERAREKGFAVVSVPHASLIVPNVAKDEGAEWRTTRNRRTQSRTTSDPYYNDLALSVDPADFRARFEPRRV